MSDVKEQSAARKVRRLTVIPQPLVARLCQHLITAIVLTVLVLGPLLGGGASAWARELIQLSVWVAGVLWLLRMLVLRKVELVSNPLVVPVLALVSYVVVRYGLAEVESVARAEMMLAVTSALLFFLVLNNVGHRAQLTWLVSLWLALATALALYGVWQWAGGTGRAHGTFLRPGEFAGFVGMILPIGLAHFFFSRWTFRTKVLLTVACLVMASGLMLSFAFGAWLGALAAVVVMGHYLMRRRNVRLRWVVVGSALWVVLVLSVVLKLQAPRLAGLEPPRWPVWKGAAHIGWEHRWIGAGPGMFSWMFSTHRNVQATPEVVRNQYLNCFAEYGVVGVGLLAWAMVMYAVNGVQILGARAERYSVNTLSNRYAFVVGGLGATLAVAVQAGMDAPLRAPANLCLLVVLVATTLTCGVHPSGKLDDDMEQPGRYHTRYVKGVTKWALAFGLLVVLGLQATRLRRSCPAEWFLIRARQSQAALDWPAATAAYQRAWSYDSRSFAIAAAAADFHIAQATWNTADRPALAAEALRWCDRAFTRNPYASEFLVKMGRAYDLLGKQGQAMERYQRALEADPRNASFHTQLGLHHLRWQNAEQAIPHFRRAYELDPADSVAEQELRRLGEFES